MAFLRRLGAAFEAGSPIIGHFRDQMVEDEQNQKKARVQLALQQMGDDAALQRTKLTEEGALARNRATVDSENARAGNSNMISLATLLGQHPEMADRVRENNGRIPGFEQYDMSPFLSSQRELMKPALTAVGNAHNIEDLPTKEWMTALTGPMATPDTLATLQGVANSRVPGLTRAAGANIKDVDPTTGQTTQTDAAGTRHIVGAGAQDQARLDNIHTAATARVNAMAAAMREGQVTTAHNDADLTPTNMARRATQAGMIASAQEEAKNGPAGPGQHLTTQEATNVALMPGLLQSHVDALRLEKAGATTSVLSRFGAESPTKQTIASAIQKAPFMGDNQNQQLYTQQAKAFTNVLSKILSGTTVREDEYPRYFSTFFASSGESPELVAMKQKTRETFIAAATASAGRGRAEIGRVIGQQIQAGNMMREAFIGPDAIKLSPEVAAGIASVINGAQ